MNIILVHGDNNEKSYQRLLKFIKVAKTRGWKTEKISDKTKDLSETLVSESLFGEERLFILDDLKMLNKKHLSWLNKNADSLKNTLVIYHTGKVPKSLINKLPKGTKNEEYKLPKLIWQLLDSYYPGNSKNVLKLLHEVIKTENIEFVFSMLGRQMRDLYWIKVDENSLNYPGWRKGKLKRQAGRFTTSDLEDMIAELASADVKSKTGQGNLIDLLDFIIVEKLE